MTSTPLAARTSRALARAGSDRAWVSIPRYSGPVIPCRLPVPANGLGDGQNMRLVKGIVQRRAPVPGSAEGHPLRGHGRVRLSGVIGGDQPGDIDQFCGLGRFAGPWMDSHKRSSLYLTILIAMMLGKVYMHIVHQSLVTSSPDIILFCRLLPCQPSAACFFEKPTACVSRMSSPVNISYNGNSAVLRQERT